MNEKELKIANEGLLAKRKELGIVTPSLEADKPPKCEKNLETFSPNEAWPPPSLQPVQLGSNLERWEAFNWDRHPLLRPAKRVIVDWYNGLPETGALVLAGNVGCGKTHLADAIIDLYGRWRTTFFEEIGLVKTIQATYDEKGHSERGFIQSLFRANLFVLDDLGTYQTKNTEWLQNVYNLIFNDFLTVQGKPMLITTNLAFFGENGIEERVGARSFSRLCAALEDTGRYVSLFDVPDYRIESFLSKK